MKKLLIGLLLITHFACREHVQDNPLVETNALTKAEGWWKEGVVYQLYPRSFKDTDGDGVGDLKGIIEKLDYLKSLGIDIVWLNPIYESPNDDNGYDISDYRDIMAEFGTMADFDSLLAGMHERDIKLVMDLVVNHSSDEHQWFRESRKSRDNPYRDYYHWWPAEKGKPTPRYSFFDKNNDAWAYDSLTDAYYLHYFSRKQPDLKWENPKLREEVMDIMRFWLDKGIDGFRMDAFQYVSKDTTWPVYPEGYEKQIISYYGMGPNLHDYLKEINKEVVSKYNIFTVAEGAGSTMQDALDLVKPERKELDMVYHFEIMDIGTDPEGYSLVDLKNTFTKWDTSLAGNGWNSIFLGNHDQPRMVSKYGNDSKEYRQASSKMLTTLILSMRGTPYYYYGDEIGMTNIRFDDIKDYDDVQVKNRYQYLVENDGNIEEYLTYLKHMSRDNGRTPMQWTSGKNAGFTSGTPWLKINSNHDTINVETEEKNPNSCLNYFRKAIQFRKDHKVLVYGDYELLLPNDENIYAFIRSNEEEKLLIVLNFSNEEKNISLPEDINVGESMLNNYDEVQMNGSELGLMPYQAVIFEIN
jgi:oligo-1,6-glucosidase